MMKSQPEINIRPLSKISKEVLKENIDVSKRRRSSIPIELTKSDKESKKKIKRIHKSSHPILSLSQSMAGIKDFKVQKKDMMKLENIKVCIIDKQLFHKQQLENSREKMLICRPKSNIK